MEFYKKLQELRKQKGFTQEELAEMLYVSRAAISKWESGRGYPNIDSLKNISKVFSITIDELLSGEELLCIAEQDNKQKENKICDLLFGLLDICTSLLFFLPFFAERTDIIVKEVSLLSLTAISPYFRITFIALVLITIILGVATLALQNCNKLFWVHSKSKISLLLNIIGVILFIFCLQPYAAIFLFVFLIIKTMILIKKH